MKLRLPFIRRRFRLLDLPPELFLLVIFHLTNQTAVGHLRATSRKLYQLVSPIFFNRCIEGPYSPLCAALCDRVPLSAEFILRHCTTPAQIKRLSTQTHANLGIPNTLLGIACVRARTCAIRLLLAHGVDPTVRSLQFHSWTPLHMLVFMLGDPGNQVPECPHAELYERKPKTQRTLKFRQAWWNLCHPIKCRSRTPMFPDIQPPLPRCKSLRGIKLEELAVDCVLQLVAAGADVHAIEPRTGCTPLLLAVYSKSIWAIKVLLRLGADPLAKAGLGLMKDRLLSALDVAEVIGDMGVLGIIYSSVGRGNPLERDELRQERKRLIMACRAGIVADIGYYDVLRKKWNGHAD